MLTGEHTGRFATVTRVNPRNECAVELEDGRRVAWVRVKSSGLAKAAFLAEYGDEARSMRVREAVSALPIEMRDALQTVRERVAQDRLPLLSLLQADPLEVQSSHLSFQEYFAANAICKGWRLSKAAVAPWQWPVWWANALRLGGEMGDDFGRGLLESTDEDRRSAGDASSVEGSVEGGRLALGGCIGGHRPTSLGATAEMMRAASTIELQRNRISADEAGLFSSALRATATLTVWDVSFNDLGDAGVACIANALAENKTCALRVLDLTYNNFRAEGAAALAEYVASSTSLCELSVRNNELGEEGGEAVGRMLASIRLTKLDISGTKLTVGGLGAVASALRVNACLTSLSVQDLDDDGLRVLGAALHSNPHSQLGHAVCDAFDATGGGEQSHMDVPSSGFGTGSATLLASILNVSTSLSSLNLDAFTIPVADLSGSDDSSKSMRLSIRGLPPASVVQYGLLIGSLLSANEHLMLAASPERLRHQRGSVTRGFAGVSAEESPDGAVPSRGSATLLNDFGSASGSDFTLPLAQLRGEGGVMFFDMKGGSHTREHRALVAGVVTGAFIRIHASLTRLDLRSCSLALDGAKALSEALRVNTSLTSLSLLDDQLGDDGVEHIAAALASRREGGESSVTALNLSDNGVGYRGALAMSEALRVTERLTSLDGVGMSGTYFKQLRGVDPVRTLDLKGLGDADSVIIAALLGANTTLTALDLGTSSNHMGKQWGRAVSDALSTNTVLTSLNLGSNGLGDKGGAAVAEALHGHNFKIQALDVSSNRLGRASGRAFAGVLANEPNLTSINMGHNDLGDASGRTLLEAVARNNTLTSLDLSYTRLGESVVEEGNKNDASPSPPVKPKRPEVKGDTALQSQAAGAAKPGVPIKPPEKTAVDALAVVLRTNTKLQALDVSGNTFNEKALRILVAAVKRNSHLTSLNGVGKSSLYFKILRGGVRVPTLDLKGAALAPEDVNIMCDLLQHNTTLKTLDLSHNPLGEEGGKAVATAMMRNDTMVTLDLSSCQLGPIAGAALKDMLEKGVSLTSLLLGGNPLEHELNEVGFTAEKLRDVGFTPSSLRTGGFAAEQLRQCGFSAKQLKAGGFSAVELKDGGYPANQLKLVGFTESELLGIGFTPQEVKSKLGLEGVAAVRTLDLHSTPLPMTWDRGSRDK